MKEQLGTLYLFISFILYFWLLPLDVKGFILKFYFFKYVNLVYTKNMILLKMFLA